MNARQTASLICFGALIGWTAFSDAAILNVGDWDAAIELLAQHQSVGTEASSEADPGGETETTRTEQRLTVRNSGSSLIDPRLLTFRAGATFGLSQQKQRTEVRDQRASYPQDTNLSGYDVTAVILPQNQRLSAELFADRNRQVLTRELGGRNDIDVQRQGAKVQARSLYIPSSLIIRRERFAERASIGGGVSETDERRDVVLYEGQRGWVDKQMRLRYESLDKSDVIRPELDYRSQDVYLSTDMDFGSELNRQWRGWVRGSSRSGFSAEERFQTAQELRMRHGRSLQTAYRYQLDDVERLSGSVRSHSASVSLTHQLYESLSTQLGFNIRNASFDSGRSDVYGGNLTLNYRKRLPLSGVLNASFQAGKQRQDDDFEEAFVPQERHAFAETVAQPVFLDNPNVIAGSVEVTKVSNGPPVPGCAVLPVPAPLVEGVDFTLRQVGTRTEIVPQDCSATTAGINPGDVIAVDYRFTRGGEPVTFDTDNRQWQASIDYGWIRPFFTLRRTDQDIVSGIDRGFLTDRRTSGVGVELRGKWTRLQGNLRLERQTAESDDQVFDRDQVAAQLRYRLSSRLWLSASGVIDSTSYSFPDVRESDLMRLRAELGYAKSALSATVFASLADVDDSRLDDERRLELGLRGAWRLGKLTVNGTISGMSRQRGARDSSDFRVRLQVRRRFDWR